MTSELIDELFWSLRKSSKANTSGAKAQSIFAPSMAWRPTGYPGHALSEPGVLHRYFNRFPARPDRLVHCAFIVPCPPQSRPRDVSAAHWAEPAQLHRPLHTAGRAASHPARVSCNRPADGRTYHGDVFLLHVGRAPHGLAR